MAHLTLRDYLIFFQKLDLRDKISVLKELTDLIDKEVTDTRPGSHEVDSVHDGLFGVWADEDELTEEAIINRTATSRPVELD